MDNRFIMSKNPERLEGRGPWTFEVDRALSPGEFVQFDFREMAHNGTKRYFQRFLPLDSAQVSNLDAANAITVTYNEQYDSRVLPNAVETFSQQGITHVRISNVGESDIPAGSVVLEVSKAAFGADDMARAQAQQGTLSRLVENFTGIRI